MPDDESFSCLEAGLDMEVAWVDSTALKANMHFPTDWVLLRDAVRTLVKSILNIRGHGFKRRICAPEAFLSEINALAMGMSAASRRGGKKGGKKGEGKKERKGKLRAIKKLTKVVEAHAKRYRAQLDENWAQSDLSRKEAEVILRRMDRVLEQLPEARQQAHDRIIGERAVANEKKILSLYQDHVHVIVRGKAGAEVEFGNSLFLAENAQGLIIDFELLRESSPGDAQWLQQRYEAMKSATGGRLCAVVADRGFESKAAREMLEADGTFECLCPRDPERLSQRMNEDEAFAGAMQRRAQTEGRVGILKNVFLGGTPLAKGFEHRQIQVAWAVLAHNLWVAARQKWKIPEQAAGQAA